jgi:hypothetical protein
LARNLKGRDHSEHIWEHNIIMDFMEIDWKGVDSMHLIQNRGQWQVLANMVMILQVP